MALLFEGTLSVEPSCLAVVRFASGVHLSQLRLQETNTNTLELLRHSMPSPAKPYAHMQPFTLQLDSALAPGPQVFDMPQNPEPSRMLLFQGQAWEGVHVKLYGVAQQKKRPAANQITPPDSHTKRVKAEEATPVASSSQGPQHSPISVPDWISIANLLQEHKSKRQQKARSIQQVSVASARTAWPSPASILSTQREQTQLDLISFKDSIPRAVFTSLDYLLCAAGLSDSPNTSETPHALIETVTTFIQSTSYLSSIRRQTYRVLLDALALRPSLIMSSKHAAALQFEEEANAGLLARLEDRKKIYDAITRMPVDAAEWLEILADDPSHWPFVLSIEPFDQIQDENAATQSKFWNLVLRSDDALEHAVYYLLDNSPDQLTSSPTSPQLLDFIKCAALNANGGTLPHMDLLNLQSIIVAAAVALHSRTTESHLFWQGLMDETTSLVMCRLSGLKHNEPLPAFDIWLTDASPSHALSELASSQDGNTIHLQQTSSLLASLRQEDPSALEDQWALLCPAASPLFFIVLQLCEYWMTRLEASSYTHSLHDKDGLTLGMTPLEHRRSDLVWVQITSLATLDHLLDPSSSSSISPFLCLVFRQTLAASGLGPSSALLKVIANGVLKSLSASIDPAFLADSLQQLLRLSATRCSWFAPSALATVLAGLPDARLAHRALMQVVPELSDAFANPFFSHGLDEFLAELGHLSPTLGLATAEHLVSRIQHTLDHAKTETGSSSQSYGLVLGLKRLNALSKLSTTQQTILQDDPVLASLFMAPGAAHEHQTAVSGAEHFQLSSVADLVKRPLCRHVKSDGQGFAIKRYEGSEAFRQRVQVNSNNVRPPSLHVDAFATAN